MKWFSQKKCLKIKWSLKHKCHHTVLSRVQIYICWSCINPWECILALWFCSEFTGWLHLHLYHLRSLSICLSSYWETAWHYYLPWKLRGITAINTVWHIRRVSLWIKRENMKIVILGSEASSSFEKSKSKTPEMKCAKPRTAQLFPSCPLC